jgi:putative membrane protein
MNAKRALKMSATLLVALAASGLLVGCTARQVARASTVTVKDDAQITTTTLIYSEGKAEQGRIALQRASSPQVRQFAQQLVQHHQRQVEDTRDLMEQRNMPRDMTPSSTAVHERISMQNNRLRDLEGMSFDRQFLDYQIELHEGALTSIEEDFLRDVQDPQLRAMLTSERDTVREHLQDARALRDRIDQGV